MVVYEVGDPLADIVLVQLVGDHEKEFIENEVRFIQEKTKKNFRMIAAGVDDWNKELSPWQAPPVFGKEGFGDGASETLAEVLALCQDKSKTYFIGGYSLAGLFALWAVTQTDVFKGACAASPSVWFPGFLKFLEENEIQCDLVYLSLGDKEEKTRNQVMATVGERIREAYHLLHERGIQCTLEWNPGNHFREADIRMAKGFAWAIEQMEKADEK